MLCKIRSSNAGAKVPAWLCTAIRLTLKQDINPHNVPPSHCSDKLGELLISDSERVLLLCWERAYPILTDHLSVPWYHDRWEAFQGVAHHACPFPSCLLAANITKPGIQKSLMLSITPYSRFSSLVEWHTSAALLLSQPINRFRYLKLYFCFLFLTTVLPHSL